MKLYNALDLGKECGLRTVDEAIKNVEIHYSNLFIYSEINREFHELYNDIEDYMKTGGLLEDSIIEAMKKLGERKDEKDKDN